MIRWKTRLLVAGIAVAIVGSSYIQEPAAAVTDREFQALKMQVQAQGRRIRTLERITAHQRAELGWFRECTPQPLNLGATLDLNLGPLLGTRWVPLRNAGIWTLALHPSCTRPVPSGFPFG